MEEEKRINPKNFLEALCQLGEQEEPDVYRSLGWTKQRWHMAKRQAKRLPFSLIMNLCELLGIKLTIVPVRGKCKLRLTRVSVKTKIS